MTIAQIQVKLDKVQTLLAKDARKCLYETGRICHHDTETVSDVVGEVQNELEELRLTVMAMHGQITDFRADLTTLGGPRK